MTALLGSCDAFPNRRYYNRSQCVEVTARAPTHILNVAEEALLANADRRSVIDLASARFW